MQIDWWTLALQAINFLILIWLLSRFLYRPVVDIVAKRREAAQKLLADAEAERAQIKEVRAEIAQTRKGFAAEREKILSDARDRAEGLAMAQIADAKAEAAKLLSEAKAAAARAEAASERAHAHEAEQLAIAIGKKLLTRLQPREATAAFLDGLCSKIRSLPPQSKVALQNGGAIDVATAVNLPPDERKQLQHLLSDCLGTGPSFIFRTDPSLIAGIELTSKDIVVRNNWREDLRAIREELGREEPQQDAAS